MKASRVGISAVASLAILLSLPWAPAFAAANSEQAIPPGTIISSANWQQYKQFMTDGMQALFAGTYNWKLPPQFQIVITATQHYAPSPTYIEQTEKYASQVKIVNLPDGRHTITGYVGGAPFPNPQEPMKGWKILVDDWYAYAPYVLCANTNVLAFEDRFGNISHLTQFFVQHLYDHIGDAGMPVTDPSSPGVYYTEIISVEEPEQARYTTVLTLYYADLTKSEDTYIFVPALRRSLRLSSAARCSPAIGSDYANDDTRHGAFNGNPTRFDATFLGERKVLELPQPNPDLFPKEEYFFRPLYFPKPEVGKWEVRDSNMIDVRRVPSQRPGYCYGKRILYCDKEIYQSVWADLYDENMKLWKIDYDPQGLIDVPGEGRRWTNDGWGMMFDVQNMHLTWVVLSGDHHAVRANADCKNLGGIDYTDDRFSSVRGLAEIMR